MMNLTRAEESVILHRRQCLNHRRDENDDYWHLMLLEEVAELTLSLRGKHKHAPELELTEIAGICINWMEKRGNISDWYINESEE